MISVSAKMQNQKVMENSLRSGESKGKLKQNESRNSGHSVVSFLGYHAPNIDKEL